MNARRPDTACASPSTSGRDAAARREPSRPGPGRSEPARAARRRPLAAVGVAGWLLVAGCAGPRADVNLAPLYSRTTPAHGVTEHEALGGALRAERDPVDGDLASVELRPLFGWRRGWTDPSRAPAPYRDWQPAWREDVRVDFLAPLGNWQRDRGTVRSVMTPIWFYSSAPVAGSDARDVDLLALPGILYSQHANGARQWGWFPFWGELDRFITFDHVRFVLFPLYVSARRADFTHHNVLWPVIGWTANHPEPGSDAPPRRHLRIWPLFGTHTKPGHWTRQFFLWPIYTRSVDGLWRERAEQERSWMVWPLFGLTRRSSYRAVSVAWPLFGVAWDPRGVELDPDRPPAEGPQPEAAPQEQLATERPNPAGAFWAVDAPWPFVRLQGGGRSPQAEERTRLWPFYGHFEGDGLWWRTFAWPVVQDRHEVTPDYERAAFYVIPFYQSFTLERTRPDAPTLLPAGYERGRRERWDKLWPLFVSEEIDDWRRDALLALTPVTRWNLFEHYWAWLWEVWALERRGQRQSGRSWLGLYRFESDGFERRHSLSGLWSRRLLGEGAQRIAETSLLFGLLRWRSGPGTDDGGLLSPAFPGPGWPADWDERHSADPWDALVEGARP